jgi:hypothetical protein
LSLKIEINWFQIADLQEMFVISLSSFVIQQQILNLTNQCSLFMTVRHIFVRSVRMTTHSTSLVTHARDHWSTLDFANAFVSPGVNSQAELVPSSRAYARNGAPFRWLGDKVHAKLIHFYSLKYKSMNNRSWSDLQSEP